MGGLVVAVAAVGVLWCCGRVWASAHNESPLLGLAVFALPPVALWYVLVRFPRDYRNNDGNPWLVLLGVPFWIGVGLFGITLAVPSH